MIVKANDDYQLIIAARVDTLVAALDPAEVKLIEWVNQQYGLSLSAGSFVSTDIYLDAVDPAVDADHGAILDASLYKTGTAHDRPNLLIGLGGNDQLKGDNGTDVLLGGEGDDRLEGGQGDDILVGGSGNDTYVWNTADGHDTIIDEDGKGKLLVNNVSLDAAFHLKDDADNVFQTTGGDTLTLDTATNTLTITLANSGGTLTVKNFDRAAQTLDIDLQDEVLAYNGAGENKTFLDYLAQLALGVVDFILPAAHATTSAMSSVVPATMMGTVLPLSSFVEPPRAVHSARPSVAPNTSANLL